MDSTRKLNPKAAIVALLLLGILALIAVGLWTYPPALLYGLLALGGLTAYAAVYLIVAASMKRERVSQVRSEVSRR